MRLRASNGIAPARFAWPSARISTSTAAGRSRRGSVLIIVMWIAFGLVALALYFAHSMTMELRVADNLVAGTEAEKAIESGALYVSNIVALTQLQGTQLPGMLPDPLTYECAEVPVGNGRFWLIGRDTNSMQLSPTEPMWGLVDEASKLNLNTVTFQTLCYLPPPMTLDIAASIISWRNNSTTTVDTNGGASDDTYTRMTPPYHLKGTNFESVGELRQVYGVDLAAFYGEDANLNGALDPNENDSDLSMPLDNGDGRLDSGLAEFFTVYTAEPTITTNGTARVNVSSANYTDGLSNLMVAANFKDDRIADVLSKVITTAPVGGGGRGGGAGGGGGSVATPRSFSSVLAFYLALASGSNPMTPDEFALFEDGLMSTNTVGLVNVNTASETVLAALLGGLNMDTNGAAMLIAYRQSNPTRLNSVSWVAEALQGNTQVIDLLGPYITGRTYQFTADIAAVGHFDRGYRRVRFIFDTTDGRPRIILRQDLTQLGWALGQEVRRTMQLAKQSR